MAGADQNDAGADDGSRDDHERDHKSSVAREQSPLLAKPCFVARMVAMVMMVMAMVMMMVPECHHFDPELEGELDGANSLSSGPSLLSGEGITSRCPVSKLRRSMVGAFWPFKR